MKKFLSLCAMALALGCTLTSCLDNHETNNVYSGQDFFTITGNMTQGYTLYSDHGTFVKPSAQSFGSNTNGFGSHERCLMSFQYSEENIVENGMGLQNATLVGCLLINTRDIMSLNDANDDNLLSPDSLTTVSKLEAWAYRGYLTVGTQAMYGTTAPTVNLVYDPATVSADSITLKLCYNIHKQTISGSGDYYTSFRLDKVANLCQGTSDVVATLKSDGCSDVIVKISRKNLIKGNWMQD